VPLDRALEDYVTKASFREILMHVRRLTSSSIIRSRTFCVRYLRRGALPDFWV